MPLGDLVSSERSSPFSEDDRIMHTTKQVERAFGVPVDQVGEVVMDGDRAVLRVEFGGTQHLLRWERDGHGQIFWYADDNPTRIVLGGQDRAAQRLAQALGGLPAPRTGGRATERLKRG